MEACNYISVCDVVRNKANLYHGDLTHYFRVVSSKAQNLQRPYHNIRHMLHVTVACYRACEYYKYKRMERRGMRNLLIAGLFHDFNHSGMYGADDLNLERAVRGLKECILPDDEPFCDEIVGIMRPTEYPYKLPTKDISFLAQILRDADVCQALSDVWIQQVVYGLGAELGKSPEEMLKAQLVFLGNLEFHTGWGKDAFPKELITRRIGETEDLLDLLKER